VLEGLLEFSAEGGEFCVVDLLGRFEVVGCLAVGDPIGCTRARRRGQIGFRKAL